MKFDKEMVIAFVLCGLLLVFWQPLCVWMGWMPDPAAAVPAAAPVQEMASPAGKTEAAAPASDAVPAQKTAPAVKLQKELPAVRLANEQLICEILPSRGAIGSITLKNYKTADRKSDIVIDQVPSAGTPQGALQPGALGVMFSGGGFVPEGIEKSELSGNTFTLIRRGTVSGAPVLLKQIWTLDKGNVLSMDLAVANCGGQAMTLANMTVSGGELQGWSNVSGDQIRMDSFRLDYYSSKGSHSDVSADAKDSKFFRTESDLLWTALSNKFFISILKAEQPFALYQGRVPEPGQPDRYFVTAGASYPAVQLAPGETKTWKFRLYAGPKITAELKAFAPDADRTMHLAWGPLDYLARLLLWLLIILKSWCGSYGWGIIILTILVRLLFWPATAKANASMKKMSKVQPKIQALREKYKGDQQMLNTKMMELYRQEGVNPMGGCLPILLQIPVFFALYATLDGAVELRQVAFWWANDLAAPDTVAHIFGLPINPLVLAMTLLMVVQQRMTPSAMDPMQQKMMLIMPVVMLFFLYNLPSGLTLYWTVSQIFSILQMLLQKHYNTAAPAPTSGSAKQA